MGTRRQSTHRRRGRARGFERLEPRLAMAGVVINEFLAANASGVTDNDGDRVDWIELHNTEAVNFDLTGWYLTDDPAHLTKWQFPVATMLPNSFLTIWASGKDRRFVRDPLHTNFSLNEDGEYLALVMPDGVTVADSYDLFPPQLPDVSYGRGTPGVILDTLVDQTETSSLHVPASGALGTTWTQIAFDDSGWIAGETPIGYERTPGGAIDYTSYFETNVNALMPAAQNRDTIYMRIEFAVADVAALETLLLDMQYDDGFVAYLNGSRVASANAPGSPAWNSQATTTHADNQAVQYEAFPIHQHLDKLVEGTNVLAIHGLNRSTSRSDFLIGPALVAGRSTPPVVGFMTTPTPGATNLPGTLGLVADTKFSVDRGFYAAPFTVEITTATAGAEIRYTLDGSAPTASTGLVYNPASPPLITTTTNLRAAAFKTGFTPSNVDTQTYIFLDDVLQQDGAGLPPHATWGQFGPDWAMDPDVVNNPLYSGTIKDDLQAVPTMSIAMPWATLFGGGGQGIYISGKSVERPGSVEMFDAAGTQEWQIDSAVEIMGGTSTNRWNNQKLSFRITFKPPFGPTKLNAPVFVNPNFDADATTEFDTLILDAVYNFSWAYGGGSSPEVQRANAKYIQDQFVADLQRHIGGQAPHGRYVHLYLNGLYWGMYYLHERPDDSFAEAYLGGDKDDYDVLKHNGTDVVAGDATAIANYNALLTAVRQNMTVLANYQAATAKLDVDALIDYMLVNYYAGNDDWPHHNWYATFNRVDPAGKWRFHSWDAEHVLKSLSYDAIFNGALTDSPEEIHQRLMASDEYRLRFNDRVQKHLRNGGAMTPAAAAALYQLRMQDVDRAIVGESARWGDSEVPVGQPFTRENWLNTQNGLLNNYFPQRTNVVLGHFNSRGWLTTLGAPQLNNYGGTVDDDFQVTIAKPAGSPAGGVLYYTLDGSDPRLAGGGVSPTAQIYSGPIAISQATRVRTRIFDSAQAGANNDWSPEIEATFLPETPLSLRITELHYNPDDQDGVADPATLEFIEITNVGAEAVSLDGVTIGGFAANGYAFAAGQTLAAGERIIVARNPAIFSQVYGAGIRMAALGYANQNLSNGGELVTLNGPLGEVLQSFTYSDLAPWPTEADGNGKSLEIVDPLGDPDDPANWRASFYRGGSPGIAGTAPAIAGDFDGDGEVTGNDFLAWQRGLGTPGLQGSAASGDADGDRDVDADDLGLWSQNYGAAPQSAAPMVVVHDASASPSDNGEPLLADEWILPSDAAVRRPAYRPRSALAHGGENLLAPTVAAVYNRDGWSGARARRSEAMHGDDEGSSQEFDAFDRAFEQLLDAQLASALEGWHDRS